MPKYPKKELAQLVLQHCIVNEIENVIISPGSRNAPLTIGFVNHPKINAFSVVDERSAAFFALGLAQQSQKPVVLLCSSGSALLNYYPAVAEAFYSNIPLIIISADRPKHLIDIGDGQTIRQENVYENHICFSGNLIEKQGLDNDSDNDRKVSHLSAASMLLFNNKLIQEAFQKCYTQNGPVHINIPFDEPLYNTVDQLIEFDFEIGKYKNKLLESPILDEIPLEVDSLQKFVDIWNECSKKIVLIGANYPNNMLQTQLEHIIKDPSVLVLTETISNVYHNKFINNVDQLIFSLDTEELNKFKPDILLTLGGMIVSKKIKQILRKLKPKHHWHIDKLNAPDTYHCLNHHFKVSPSLFFSQLFFLTKNQKSDYQSYWLKIKSNRQKKHSEFLNKTAYSDLKVFEIILNNLPQKLHIQLSNSSVIRYSQLFDLKNSLQVFCNRGTSGIDGSSSTAIGAAWIKKSQTLFITGDISFFYDSNALWNSNIKKDFRIILINNSGGGIFRFIPGPQSTNVLDYFETPHHLNASYICEMFGFEYSSANNEKDLDLQLKGFYEGTAKPKLLEIFTPSEINDKVLKDYFRNLG
jgi:2-succinyl-5-enolpyruvyl-6-hydroxy-3-cyclohexene-1-carboxylate synthase